MEEFGFQNVRIESSHGIQPMADNLKAYAAMTSYYAFIIF